MDVESAFKVVGSFGRFQFLIVSVCILSNIGYGCQMVIMVIAGANPNPDIPSERNLTTIVTEWNLYDEQWIVDLISSLFMAGYAVGCLIFGQFSDLYGRKWIFVTNYTAMLIFCLCTSFCQEWKTFAVTRTLAGFCAGASGHVLFAVLVENIGKDMWGLVGKTRILVQFCFMRFFDQVPTLKCNPVVFLLGMIHQTFFSVGVMLLSLFGLTLQNWRYVCLVSSTFPLVLLPIFIFVMPESSRWLYHVGKVDKAEKVLQYIAEKNGRPSAGITLCSVNDNELFETQELQKYSIIDMFKRQKLSTYAVCSFYIWFACSLVYYGLTLDASTLSPNIYIATTLSGFIEIPAIIFTCLIMRHRWLGRKGSMTLLFVLSVVSSIGLLFADGLNSENLSTVQTALGLLNKLAVSGAFSLLYVYIAEIFPTQLRLVAIGGSSMFARVGAIISPFVPLLAPVTSYLPYIVFGVVAVLGAVANLFLPETLNKPSPDMSDFRPRKKPRLQQQDFADIDVLNSQNADEICDPLV